MRTTAVEQHRPGWRGKVGSDARCLCLEPGSDEYLMLTQMGEGLFRSTAAWACEPQQEVMPRLVKKGLRPETV